MARSVPDKPSLDGLEEVWAKRWEADGTYRFNRSQARHQVYAIDTPPPTVSGELHVGHVFSYTQTDIIARYQRMRGKAVFYPMGWDDNGLPTERRAQAFYGVTCDPSLPYDPDFLAPDEPHDPPVPIARGNFIELCHRLTALDEQVFEDLFRRLGLSVDWHHTYTTIDERSRRASQRAFLRNLARGEAYHQEAPVLWDVDFRTAVAQAELEDRQRPGAYHRLLFHRADGSGAVAVETTRPELVCSCVAVVAHPDDDRFRSLVGQTLVTPVFGVEVPVVTHELADPEKGTGAAMICTFGDTTDVTWWRELDLPTRAVVGRDGRLQAEVPGWIVTGAGQAAYQELAGRTVRQAQRQMVELLTEAGGLEGEPRPITHPVKFYERGERPLEIVTSRQWYIRNGGRDPDLRSRLLARGEDLTWLPPHMGVRYRHWVEGLAGDWLISRQRFFGVPIPVWYRLDGNGEPVHDEPIVPDEAELPVDPSSDPAPGFDESQRGRPGGFIADPDVLDTWATSSLSPQIAGGWEEDDDLFSRVFPMDLRPQAHEIIRTWLFSTVVRAHHEFGSLPWRHAAISGWILDPERKKMSKSKGNVVVPTDPFERYGSDATRYWAASARLGADTAYDEGQMKIGRRLAIKLLNASRFVLGLSGEVDPSAVVEPLDRAMMGELVRVVEAASNAFESYDQARAVDVAESAFWSWTDDYLELVKGRAYGDGPAAASAHASLQLALSVFLRLFAPVLPFVTEEVWSWWRPGSVHLQSWPTVAELEAHRGDTEALRAAADVLAQVRRAKSEAKLSMRAGVASVTVTDQPERIEAVRLAEPDLLAATTAQAIEYRPGEFSVETVLA